MTYEQLSSHLFSIFKKKNAAYGNSAHESFEDWGDLSYVIRISDKFRRLKMLDEHADLDQYGESILDTLADAVNYLIMYYADVMWLDDPSYSFAEHATVAFAQLADEKCLAAAVGLEATNTLPTAPIEALEFILDNDDVVTRSAYIFCLAVRTAQTYIAMQDMITKEESDA